MLASYLFCEWYVFSTRKAQLEVWSAYLNKELRIQTAERARRPAGLPVLVIQDHTQQAYRHWLLALLWPAVGLANQTPRSPLPTLQAGAYCRYLLGNLLPHAIDKRLTLSGPYHLADASTIAAYGQRGPGWERLFPRSVGYFVLSTVGFTADQNQALLQIDHFCGLCGHGGYVLLRKVNGGWVIEAEAGTWVS
jgi:hypothetical protein